MPEAEKKFTLAGRNFKATLKRWRAGRNSGREGKMLFHVTRSLSHNTTYEGNLKEQGGANTSP